MEINLGVWGKTYTPTGGEGELYYPLLAHMLDTVAASRVIYRNWLSPRLKAYLEDQFNDEEHALNAITLACGLHDLGKCSPIFQAAMLSPRKDVHASQKALLEASGLTFPNMDDFDEITLREKKLHRHEKLGHWLLSGQQDTTRQPISESWLMLSILGHHGSYEIKYARSRGRSDARELNHFFTKDWLRQVDLHTEVVEKVANFKVSEAREKVVANAAVILLSGLIILSDRLASNEETVQYSHEYSLQYLSDPQKYVDSQEVFLTGLTKRVLGFANPVTAADILGDYSPRGVQTSVPETNGLWLVMAATGSGKTEAALLRHSHETENLLFLLPTKSTTDAMFARIMKTYSEKQQTIATVAHSDARLNAFYNHSLGFDENYDNEGCGTGLIPSKLTNAGAKLSAPITIATIDQMVMAGIPLKWSPLRLLTIANSHVIIDEAHLIDEYQFVLISELLAFLGQLNVRVTILSATMPEDLKRRIVESYTQEEDNSPQTVFPSAETHTSDAPTKILPLETLEYEVHINVTESIDPESAHIEWAEKTLKKSPNARLGIFVNTVTRSQEISTILQEQHPDATVICLNSRMLGKHKAATVKKLLEEVGSKTGKAKRLILVGTQLIEMSLDIDLDYISSDLAPAPSLIQRLGRAWRNRSPESMQLRSERICPEDSGMLQLNLVAFHGEENKLHLPYPETQLKRTLSFIQGLPGGNLIFPTDIQEFVNRSYTPDDTLGVSEDGFEEEQVNKIFKQLKAETIKSPILDFLHPDAQVTDANLLTHSQLGEDTSTRLIEGNYLNLVLYSDDPEIQKIGALPLETDPQKTSLSRLKAATIPLSFKLQKALETESIKPIQIRNHDIMFATQLPTTIIYDSLTGLKC